MKTIKTKKEMREVEVTESIEYTCDRCGTMLKKSMYITNTNKIVFMHKESGPAGGMEKGEKAYFCNECSNIVKSTLINIGVKFESYETDW